MTAIYEVACALKGTRCSIDCRRWIALLGRYREGIGSRCIFHHDGVAVSGYRRVAGETIIFNGRKFKSYGAWARFRRCRKNLTTAISRM